MTNENPIQGLNDQYINIIRGSIIKYSYLAEAEEDLEMRKYVDEYTDAYYKKDTFNLYIYELEEYEAIGLTDASLIRQYMLDQSTIPRIYRERLLEVRRQSIIANYVERNNYYRMLNGYPNLDEVEFVYLDYDTAVQFGIDPTIPVHEIEDVAGSYYINRLEAAGILDQIVADNPDKPYLQYLASKRIDCLDARRAKNFELLYLDSSIPNSIYDVFTPIYEACRSYYMSTIYTAEHRNVIEYYDRFIGLCIMVMALQQLTTRSIAASIDRDYFDTRAVQALYEEYDIPFFTELDEATQRVICQNINILIQNKGTNKVIYDIASLLGYSRIDVYKYYIMKEHLMDNSGEPYFVTKEQFNEDTGEYETVYDYEAMFDVYFQKVRLDDWDYYEALEDKSNRVGYESVTSTDPLWIEDDDLYKEIWESEYNYKESKYLGITISYKLSEMIYENILLIRMLIDQKDGIDNIDLKLPMITGDLSVSLFDTIVLLCALTSKKYGLRGEIITTASKTLAVLEGIQKLDDPYAIGIETSCFDFSFLADPQDFKDRTSEIYSYMSEEEIRELEGYLTILTVTGSSQQEKIDAVNNMYQNIRGISKFLSDKISYSETVEEYRAFTRFFDALFYANETKKCFAVTDGAGTTTVPDTFLEYLNLVNPTLSDFVDGLDQKECYTYLDHVISRLEDLIEDLQYMYIINNSTSSIQDVLIELIRFFKSYTTDLIGLNIVYVFDFKPDNMMKLFDRIESIRKTLMIKDDLFFSYADAVIKAHVNMTMKDWMSFKDAVRLHANIRMMSMLSFTDMVTMQKLIATADYTKWIDEIIIHTKQYVPDEGFRLWDALHYIYSKAYTNDMFNFFDEIRLKKKIMVPMEFDLYDFIAKIKETINYGEYNMILHDDCLVVRR